MVNTALVRLVKASSAPMADVEKFSAQPFMEMPMKSKAAAPRAE